MSHGAILLLMTLLFVVFGYMGVPVAFALMAGVLTACMLTPISMQSMIGQMFHGIDSEILLAVPFFLLVGELMTSANVTNRMIALAQTMVGHMRGGLAQVVTLFSMFFAGISGSSTADVAVLSRTVAPEMTREGYDRAFTAALIACASTMANLIPPSIMAVVYGATGNVSIGGLFLRGHRAYDLFAFFRPSYSYFGRSMAVDFDGNIICKMGENEGMTKVDIYPSLVEAARRDRMSNNYLYQLKHRGYTGVAPMGRTNNPFTIYRDWDKIPERWKHPPDAAWEKVAGTSRAALTSGAHPNKVMPAAARRESEPVK